LRIFFGFFLPFSLPFFPTVNGKGQKRVWNLVFRGCSPGWRIFLALREFVCFPKLGKRFFLAGAPLWGFLRFPPMPFPADRPVLRHLFPPFSPRPLLFFEAAKKPQATSPSSSFPSSCMFLRFQCVLQEFVSFSVNPFFFSSYAPRFTCMSQQVFCMLRRHFHFFLLEEKVFFPFLSPLFAPFFPALCRSLFRRTTTATSSDIQSLPFPMVAGPGFFFFCSAPFPPFPHRRWEFLVSLPIRRQGFPSRFFPCPFLSPLKPPLFPLPCKFAVGPVLSRKAPPLLSRGALFSPF